MIPEVERITPYVTRQWRQERRIVIYTLEGARRYDLDKLAEAVLAVVHPWDKNKPLLIMYDVSGAAMTPYARERASYIGDQIPLGIRGRTAIVLPKGLMFRIFAMFFNTSVPLQNEGMKREFFLSQQKALAWLEEGLE